MQNVPDPSLLIAQSRGSTQSGAVARIRIGTAGWSIPKEHAAPFSVVGSHLERYGAVLDAVEINSSFYRSHRTATYERWAASVPEDFRFAVKVPKAITHERRLMNIDDLLDRFLSEAGGLGPKLGPLLIQLPPSLSFEPGVADSFLSELRSRVQGSIVCEPRHASWSTPEVEALLDRLRIARVAADPATDLHNQIRRLARVAASAPFRQETFHDRLGFMARHRPPRRRHPRHAGDLRPGRLDAVDGLDDCPHGTPVTPRARSDLRWPTTMRRQHPIPVFQQ
jgi:uncharacterized protein YecE (DUF72 family)